jgi:hypothetical protein
MCTRLSLHIQQSTRSCKHLRRLSKSESLIFDNNEINFLPPEVIRVSVNEGTVTKVLLQDLNFVSFEIMKQKRANEPNCYPVRTIATPNTGKIRVFFSSPQRPDQYQPASYPKGHFSRGQSVWDVKVSLTSI